MSTDNKAITAIEAALTAILEPGQVVELRVLDYVRPGSSYPCTMSGYFDDYRAMAEEAAKLTPHASGVYFTPNPVKPELLARVCNKTRAMGKGDSTTSDKDVTRRRWFPIDCDAARVSGISASEEEHAAAVGKAEAIRAALSGEGWPEPILADSGNGGHLMYRVDLPADDGGLLKTCLEALKLRFEEDAVQIDTSVFNPARIWKLYGTLARKGENLPERPHRQARIISKPQSLEVVAEDQLAALAACLGSVEQAEADRRASPRGAGFDIEAWDSEPLERERTRSRTLARREAVGSQGMPVQPRTQPGGGFHSPA